MLSGLAISTLDPSFDKDGIKHIFSITKPKIMFCDGDIYKNVKEALKEIKLNINIYTMNNHAQGVPDILEFLKETGHESTFKLKPLKLGHLQTAVIMCSSGTTGLPKGVSLSHESLLNKFAFPPVPEMKILCFSTLYWVTGLVSLISATISNITRVVSQKGYNPEDFIGIIKKYNVEMLISPPSQIALLLASPKIKDADMSCVKLTLCLGSAVPYSLVEKIRPYMPNAQMMSGYGMTETCGGITGGYITPNGSLGLFTTNVEVKVVDDDENSLGPCECGEILIRSSLHWAGYYGNTEATAATYDKDGWIHSGDIGYIDNDGNLFVVDRKKDILKHNNFHFFPTEIENVITEIPGVLEVCVCGIPDIISTHLPAAAVVKAPGSTLSEDEIYNYVAKKMAHFKHIIPKTASGKNVRRIVAETCDKLKNTQINVIGVKNSSKYKLISKVIVKLSKL